MFLQFLSITLLLVVVMAAGQQGSRVFIQCEAQTIRQDRINELCDKLDDRLKQTGFTYSEFITNLWTMLYGPGKNFIRNNPGKARLAESIFKFCKNNAGE